MIPNRSLRLKRLAVTAVVAAAGLVGAVAGAGGCAAEKPTAHQPTEAKPARLHVSASQPEDADGNGYPDSTLATVYIFADPTEYEIPILVPGSFTFRLLDPKGTQIARWEFDEEQTRGAQRRLPVGPGYMFALSLLDVGGDRVDSTTATLSARFTPRDGHPIERAASATFRLGKQNR